MDAKMPLLQLVTQAKKPMPARPLQDATRLASAWALVNASIFIVSYGLSSAIVPALCQLPWCDLCREDAMERALLIGLWCCVALQAAAAALALLLPCRRHWIRRAVAYLAVAVAIVGHCLLASIAPLAADAGLGLLVPLIVYAVAALVLLLPCRCRRICHALAYLALAVAVAAVVIGCCILASFVPIAVDTGLGRLRLILLVVYVAVMFISLRWATSASWPSS
nr:uncharacterized protein LOC109771567 [Aegilops tauschii subsp. strangulata]